MHELHMEWKLNQKYTVQWTHMKITSCETADPDVGNGMLEAVKKLCILFSLAI